LQRAQSFVAEMAGAAAAWENPADGLEVSGSNLLLEIHGATEAKGSFLKPYSIKKLTLIPGTQTGEGAAEKAPRLNSMRKAVTNRSCLFRWSAAEVMHAVQGAKACEPNFAEVAVPPNNKPTYPVVPTQMAEGDATGPREEAVRDPTALQNYMDNLGNSRHEKEEKAKLKKYPTYVRTHEKDGERFPGGKVVDGTHVQRDGRMFAVGPSQEGLSNKARAVAGSGQTFGVDFVTSVLPVIKAIAATGDASPPGQIMKIATDPDARTDFLAEYHSHEGFIANSSGAPRMAVHEDWAALESAVKNMKGRARSELLEKVRFAPVKNAPPLADAEARRAFVVAQVVGLAPKEYTFPSREHPCRISFNAEGGRAGRLRRRGPSCEDGCSECNGDKACACNFTFFQDARMYYWMDKVGCLAMRIADDTRKIMLQELSRIDHKVVDARIPEFRRATSDWRDAAPPQTIKNSFEKQGGIAARKPAAASPVATKSKRASAMKPPMKKTATMKRSTTKKTVGRKFAKQAKKTIHKRALIADESFLNKRKPGKLNKRARPQNSCGSGEMPHNISLPNTQKGRALVPDKWGAAMSAAKALRRSRGLTETALPHEPVNHDAGEVLNERGFSTHAVEAKWSALERWVRGKHGGRLPSHSHGDKWRQVANESQA
ncbi:unnamed protein product, partial [Prorocentrum cordatum]